MNKNQCPSIDLTDAYTLLAVWHFSWSGWQLIKVERPSRAIAYCQPPFTLAFPTSVKPDELAKKGAAPFRSGKATVREKTEKLLEKKKVLPKIPYCRFGSDEPLKFLEKFSR
ncbi:MAG: hypothetical protein HC820_06625 [Hydrococcus sp. RM1_1_31]|nr:hypothetical protein [Hydrococcus sp. RM1_1_31]